MRVLIADDEIKVCNLVRNLIDWEGLGLELIGTVHSGEAALEYIYEYHPEIVITDIRMPGCSGIEMITKVREQGLDTYFIIISGYRQFDYASQAIKNGVEDYLLKPLKQKDIDRVLRKIIRKHTHMQIATAEKADLLERVDRDGVHLREHLLHDLLGERTDATMLNRQSINSRCGSAFEEGTLMVMLVQAYSAKSPEAKEGRTLLESKIRAIIENELSPAFVESAFTVYDGGVAGLLNGNDEHFASLRKALRRISTSIQGLGDIFDRPCFVLALSKPVTDFQALPNCVHQARKAMAQRLFVPVNSVVEYSVACEPFFDVDDVVTLKFRTDLRHAVSALDDEHLVLALHAMRDRLIGEPRTTGWDVKQAYEEIVRLFTIAAKDNGIKLQENVMMDLQEHYHSAKTVAEIFEGLSEHFSSVMVDWRMGKNAEESRPIRTAKKYIHLHYTEPLTLQMMSDLVGLNATYFSSAFKHETGENFLDYLAQVRIDAAKEMLADTDISISDVAERVGYQDMKYFYKRFKKFAGIGPKEYRRLYG